MISKSYDQAPSFSPRSALQLPDACEAWIVLVACTMQIAIALAFTKQQNTAMAGFEAQEQLPQAWLLP